MMKINYDTITQDLATQYEDGGQVTLEDLAQALHVRYNEMLYLAAAKRLGHLKYGYQAYVAPQAAAQIIADVQTWRQHHKAEA